MYARPPQKNASFSVFTQRQQKTNLDPWPPGSEQIDEYSSQHRWSWKFPNACILVLRTVPLRGSPPHGPNLHGTGTRRHNGRSVRQQLKQSLDAHRRTWIEWSGNDGMWSLSIPFWVNQKFNCWIVADDLIKRSKMYFAYSEYRLADVLHVWNLESGK